MNDTVQLRQRRVTESLYSVLQSQQYQFQVAGESKGGVEGGVEVGLFILVSCALRLVL